MTAPRERGWVVLGGVLLLLAVFGVGLTWAAWAQTPGDRHHDFWIDVGGAGLQLVVVVVLGAIVTASLGWLDRRRENRRRRDELRLRIFDDLVAGYNKVKAVRRNLRALGLRQPPDELNEGQTEGFRAQMTALVDAQLSFEAVKRELNANSAAFDDPRPMLSYITSVEEYLHAIINEWEDEGGAVWAGASGQAVKDLTRLQAFIDKKQDFIARAATPMRAVQQLVRQEVVGRELTLLAPDREADD